MAEYVQTATKWPDGSYLHLPVPVAESLAGCETSRSTLLSMTPGCDTGQLLLFDGRYVEDRMSNSGVRRDVKRPGVRQARADGMGLKKRAQPLWWWNGAVCRDTSFFGMGTGQ